MAKDEHIMNNTKPTEVGVFIAPELRSAKYSNAIQVYVSTSDVTINFIYINPNDEPTGTLVSRVVIPHEQAKDMARILSEVPEQLEKLKEIE